jgi:hypothetical protein
MYIIYCTPTAVPNRQVKVVAHLQDKEGSPHVQVLLDSSLAIS